MKRTLILLGPLVIILSIVSYVFMRTMDAPSSATDIKTEASTRTSTSQSLSLGKPVPVAGTYADFSYPSIFTIEKPGPVSGSLLAEYSYEYHEFVPWQLTITIHFLSGNEKYSDSAYYSMTQDTTRYTETVSTVNGSQVDVFTDTTAAGFDKLAVLFHGSYSADISLTTEDTRYITQEQSTLNEVIQGWQWK